MPSAKDRISTKYLNGLRVSSAQKQTLRRKLLIWYGKHARDLPWRRSRDPYRVWISEIMLQQTQVATVRDYFSRFVRALPRYRTRPEVRHVARRIRLLPNDGAPKLPLGPL